MRANLRGREWVFNHEGVNPWSRPSKYKSVHEKTKAGKNRISEHWKKVQESTLLLAAVSTSSTGTSRRSVVHSGRRLFDRQQGQGAMTQFHLSHTITQFLKMKTLAL